MPPRAGNMTVHAFINTAETQIHHTLPLLYFKVCMKMEAICRFNNNPITLEEGVPLLNSPHLIILFSFNDC